MMGASGLISLLDYDTLEIKGERYFPSKYKSISQNTETLFILFEDNILRLLDLTQEPTQRTILQFSKEINLSQ